MNIIGGKNDNRTFGTPTWRENMIMLARLHEIQLSASYAEPTKYEEFQNITNRNIKCNQQKDMIADKRFKASALTSLVVTTGVHKKLKSKRASLKDASKCQKSSRSKSRKM